MIQISPGIQGLEIPQALASATQQIILHAAMYGNFAAPAPHATAIRSALAASPKLRLTAIRLAPDCPEPERSRAFSMLRKDWSEDALREHFAASDAFLSALEQDFPAQVRVLTRMELGAFPVLVIDNGLFWGSYAHASVPAPEGFWFSAQMDAQTLADWATHGIAHNASPEQRAVFRVYAECLHATKETSTTQGHRT